MSNELIAALYITNVVFVLLLVVTGVILIWFRKAIFDYIKLRKLMKLGYIIARLKRIDKTEKEIVVKPDPETNGIKFPGVEGTYILDNASVILKNRIWPVYEWREGETAPINYEKEYELTKVECPFCKKEIHVNVQKPKSIAPSVLDNLILKIKTLSQMMTMDKLLIYLLIGGIVVVIAVGINIFFTYDLEHRIGELIAPTIAQYCKNAAQNATIII